MIYMFIYEFRLSQAPGNFDRFYSAALSTRQARPPVAREWNEKTRDKGSPVSRRTHGMSPALPEKQITQQTDYRASITHGTLSE
jgi:hypothetical protein